MMNKRDRFEVLLDKLFKLFKQVTGRPYDICYNGIGRMTSDQIEQCMKELNLVKLPDDYVWMLKKYGVLNIGGYDVLGYYNDTNNFLKCTLAARNGSGEDYFGYKLQKNYVVLEHDESSSMNSDIVLNVEDGLVYWWGYDTDEYYDYDVVPDGTSFLDFLIQCAELSIEGNTRKLH